MSKRPIAIQLSRLDKALKAQGVTLKRNQLLTVSAAAFGFRYSNELTAATNDIVPPEANPIGVVEHEGERVVLARDVLSNSIFAVDETFLEQISAEDNSETWLPTPYGHLAAINRLLDQPITTITTITNNLDEGIHFITSKIDDEMLFWSNTDGWVDFVSATPFPRVEGRLPLSKGTTPKWISRDDAIATKRPSDLEVVVGKEILEQATKIAKFYPPIMASFTPQVWFRDNALEVDPQGETTYDVTVDLIAYALQDGCETLEEYLDGTDNDEFREANEAPEWVYDWTEPFYIGIDVPMQALIVPIEDVESGKAYACDPEDGHDHRFEEADGIDTGTDKDATICVLCGTLSVED